MTRTHDPLPAGPDAITPRWLAARLREAGALAADATIEGLAYAPVELGGVNGDVFRLLPSYAGDRGPASVIAKFPASTAAARGVAAFQRWYERELRAYGELNTGGALPMARAFFAALGDGGQFVLLLEDLRGMEAGDQLAGCDPRRAEAAVRTIAGVHARWWDADALTGALDWLPLTTVGLDHATPVQGAFGRGWSAVRDSFARDAGFVATIDRAVDRYRDLLAAIATPPLTVIHGDYRLDNLFFDAAADPTRVIAIDWQFTARCRGAYDLAYFVGLNLDVEARRSLEAPLRAAYIDALAGAGVSGYDATMLGRDYAIGLLLTFATFAIGAAGAQANARMATVHRVGLERLAAAIADADDEVRAALA